MADETGYGIIENACIGIQDRKIVWIWAENDLPQPLEKLSRTVHDGGGRWVTPALIDCHTHLAYAGNRAGEFEQKLQGVKYEDIAKAGGGIVSSMRAVRETSEDALYELTRKRVQDLFREGIATFEIKSGYGLDLVSEEKQLRVATRVRDDLGVRVQRTFLGAHALPPEFKATGDSDGYIRLISEEMIPKLHKKGLVDAVDAFCEGIGFSPEQVSRVFDAAKKLSIPVKLHAEQLSNLHGAALTAKYKGLSADHLEYIDEAGVMAMAKAGTTAVLLPGAFYFMREKTMPPVDLFRKHHVPVALATDHNPGTSPTFSLLLMVNMGCVLFRLTPEEALAGVTRNAAKALGYQNVCGTLEKGKAADFALWDIEHPRDLSYFFGGRSPCRGLVVAGEYHDFKVAPGQEEKLSKQAVASSPLQARKR
ncbi:MAG: imidazolonepropionase [Pseudomonadota bacterium]